MLFTEKNIGLIESGAKTQTLRKVYDGDRLTRPVGGRVAVIGWGGKYRYMVGAHIPVQRTLASKARCMIVITEIGYQKLWDIDDNGARREGIRLPPGTLSEHEGQYRNLFAELWESIYSKDPFHCWAANPEVWVISFAKV